MLFGRAFCINSQVVRKMLLTGFYATFRPWGFTRRPYCHSLAAWLFCAQSCAGSSNVNKARLLALGAPNWLALPSQLVVYPVPYKQAKPQSQGDSPGLHVDFPSLGPLLHGVIYFQRPSFLQQTCTHPKGQETFADSLPVPSLPSWPLGLSSVAL